MSYEQISTNSSVETSSKIVVTNSSVDTSSTIVVTNYSVDASSTNVVTNSSVDKSCTIVVTNSSLDASSTIVVTNSSVDPSCINVAINLAQMLLDNVNIPSYNLTQDQINWVNKFITDYPDHFTTITQDIKALTSSGEIGIQNIPQIIKLIAGVYNSSATNDLENIIVFIKFTTAVILSSPLVILSNVEKDILEQIIDVSLDLLVINIGTIESKVAIRNCWVKFTNFCRCK
jgi:hypothetical protein